MSSLTQWPRAIAHVDLDQFYAAVEILDDPSLKGKPLIVGGLPGGRGVVCTASYEARKFGVHSAMASSLAARLCPQGIWRAPRMSRYVEKSHEIHAVFERYTDGIEPLSLDEAFLDLTGSLKLFGPPETIAARIKKEILAETGLVASVGVAENKFLAKVASDLRKPDALVVVPPGAENARAFLAPLPHKRLWGVGPKAAELLGKHGFRTVDDIARAELAVLARILGESAAEHLIELAHGRDARPVERGGMPKSIGRENTFSQDLFDFAAMERELLAFADDVAARLRAKRLRCGTLTLKVRFSDFSRITRSDSLHEPVDVARPLHASAVRMLRERVNLNGRGVRLLGLSAQNLQPGGAQPASLFADQGMDKQRDAAKAVDRLRARFGDDAVTFGRLLEAREKTTGTPGEKPPER
jgi:DNA polymerase IV